MKLYDVYNPINGRISKEGHSEQWLNSEDVDQLRELGFLSIPKENAGTGSGF